jgi:hypothetical protein
MDAILHKLQSLKKEKIPLYVWGAGAKGSTFVNLFDPYQEYISSVIDINTNKQNKYIASTAHRIIAPEAIESDKGRIIILNSNYKSEIEKEIAKHRLKCDVYEYEELK